MEGTVPGIKPKTKKVTKAEIAYAKKTVSYAKLLFERVIKLSKDTDTRIHNSLYVSISKGERLDEMINIIGLSNTHDIVINQFRVALIEFERRIAMELANVMLLNARK